MTKLVINADDFGYSPGINHGIIDCYQRGVLTSTTLMANMPGFDQAVSLSRANPGLGVGVHLSMTCGQPLLASAALVQENGCFKPLSQLKAAPLAVDLAQLYEEWDAQIAKVSRAGVAITHLDSHHYTHAYGHNWQVMEALATKYQLPMRNCFGVKERLEVPSRAPADEFWNLFNYPGMKDVPMAYPKVKEQLFEIIQADAERYCQQPLVEAVCHPGYLDTTVWLGSRFNLGRMREIDLLCDPHLKQLLTVLNYQLCCYNEL